MPRSRPRARSTRSRGSATWLRAEGIADEDRSWPRATRRPRRSVLAIREGVIAQPAPPVEWMFDWTYAEPPAALARQRARRPSVTEITGWPAPSNAALRDALRDDPAACWCSARTSAACGGVFRVTDGLQAEFGAERVFDTPISEAGIAGAAVGLAFAGWRSVDRDAVRRVQLPGARADRSTTSRRCASARAAASTCRS